MNAAAMATAPAGRRLVVAPEQFQRLRAGDSQAWGRLFHGYAPRIYRWAVLRGVSPGDAEELAQEVLAVAWRRIDTCHAPEALTSWLYQITRRQVANHRRKAWFRRVFVSERPPERAFVAEPETSLSARAVLAGLPADLAEVLILRDVEGHTRDEVATLLGLKPGTVASRLRRARAAFEAAWTAREGRRA